MKKSELKERYALMFPDYPDIVSVAQLQTMLGISRHQAYTLIRDGSIAGILVGNAYRIPKFSVIDYVYSGQLKKEEI